MYVKFDDLTHSSLMLFLEYCTASLIIIYTAALFPEGKWLLQHIREWVFLKNN